MRVRQLCTNFRLLLLFCLCSMVLLTFAPAAAADGYQTFAGPFTVTTTSNEIGANGKIAKDSSSDSGTMYFYLGENGPTKNQNGNYMEFVTNTYGLRVAIKSLAMIKSEVPNAKTDTIMAVGVGEFYSDTGMGPVYLDISKGTLTPGGGQPNSISMTMKMGGGPPFTSGEMADNYVWHGSLKVTLTPQTGLP